MSGDEATRRLPRSPILVATLLLLGLGCQRAQQYPAAKAKRPAAEEAAQKDVPPHYAWIDPGPSLDVPIVFVDAASRPDEWKALPGFWTHQWSGIGGQRTAHLGLPPLGALVALRLSAAHEVIKVKVPLGLPDPTPNIPAANPPTHGKWLLGKRLFFERTLRQGDVFYACRDCHDPAKGFTIHSPTFSQRARKNPPTLINAVYNRHQFWDGRATYLEEVIQRTLADEAPTGVQGETDRPEVRHAWPGLVKHLSGHEVYLRDFQRVFGTEPTQDNIAKAVATYVRTILSGNSVYDRARSGAAPPRVEDFRSVFDQDKQALKALAREGKTKRDTARELVQGYELFHGKARCAVCHPGPLFTDHDFHNAGIGESRLLVARVFDMQTGRFPHLPPGLKALRYVGAFKTPILRALPRTAPYMHDGSLPTLAAVIGYFDKGINADFNKYLDPELSHGREKAQRLNLDPAEVRALELFLKSLDGEAVPRLVAQP